MREACRSSGVRPSSSSCSSLDVAMSDQSVSFWRSSQGKSKSVANMPVVLRTITYIIPARYYIEVTRGIFLKGNGPAVLWDEAVAMLLYAVIGLGLATRAFRKEISA